MAKKSFKDGELQERYGTSEAGNFFVRETIGVPHPYCIGPGHVAEAADHHGGMLGESAIQAAEQKRIYCCTCKGKLKFEQHETALLVACKEELKVGEQVNPELQSYLLSIKGKVEEDGFAGWAFIRA
jgi:hypothetical protein